MRKTGVFVAMLVLAGIAAVQSEACVAGPAAYVTAERVMSAFQENGLKMNGVKRTVLDVACVGAGYSRGSFPYQRYHIFECYITTATRSLVGYRVTTSSAGAGGSFYYQYQAIP